MNHGSYAPKIPSSIGLSPDHRCKGIPGASRQAKTQQVNENKDSKNIELDSKKENELTEDNEKEITETETKEKEIQEGQENEDKVTDIKEDDDPNAKWYVVGAASGFEERAVKTIQDNARKASLSHFFF